MGHMTPNESISGAPNYGIGCTKEFGMPPGGPKADSARHERLAAMVKQGD
jgi:hypothetical protein